MDGIDVGIHRRARDHRSVGPYRSAVPLLRHVATVINTETTIVTFVMVFSRFDKLDVIFIGFILFALIVDGLR